MGSLLPAGKYRFVLELAISSTLFMLRVQILLVYEYAVIKFPALIYVVVN